MKHSNISELVVEYIITMKMNDLSELTRYKIAGHFGINQNYLSVKIKQKTQMTVSQLIDFEKMKRAEKLLRTRSDITIEVISKMVGIMKCNQFRSKFKKFYGLNPGKYRSLFKS